MTKTLITDFDLDAERLAVIKECMQHYDVGNADAEWPNNIISRHTVVYRSGIIARRSEASVPHAIDQEELALCRRLAGEAITIMGDTPVGMGSEADDPFHDFFIPARVGMPCPTTIDEALIRSRFAYTIFPLATISVEPLDENGDWWSEVAADGAEAEAAYLLPWRTLLQWFHQRREFITTAFVRIGDQQALWNLPPAAWPVGTESTGCVLPRLALGLTQNGSLVGLFGYSVQT